MLPHFHLPRSLLLLVVPLVFADVEFTYPKPGDIIPVGSINVTWKGSGRAPGLADLSVFQLELMVGGDVAGNMLPLQSFANGAADGAYFSNSSSWEGTVLPGVAETIQNGFYFRMTSEDYNGGIVINYSDRFTITGLTGYTATVYRNAVKALNGNTDGPPRSGNVPALLSTSSQAHSTATSTLKSGQTVTVTADVKGQPTAHHHSSHSGKSLDMSALAGIVVGAFVLFISLVTLIAFIFMRRRRRRRSQDINPDPDFTCVGKDKSITSLSELSAEGKTVEIGAGIPPPEMDSTNVRCELEGSPVVWAEEDDRMQWTAEDARSETPGITPLTPIAPSDYGEETLEGPIDFLTSPVTAHSDL